MRTCALVDERSVLAGSMLERSVKVGDLVFKTADHGDVTTRDFRRSASSWKPAPTRGAISMSSQFRRSDMPELKKKVRDMALAAAKDKAKQTAQALGVDLGKIMSVGENSGGYMWNQKHFPQNAVARDNSSGVARRYDAEPDARRLDRLPAQGVAHGRIAVGDPTLRRALMALGTEMFPFLVAGACQCDEPVRALHLKAATCGIIHRDTRVTSVSTAPHAKGLDRCSRSRCLWDHTFNDDNDERARGASDTGVE